MKKNIKYAIRALIFIIILFIGLNWTDLHNSFGMHRISDYSGIKIYVKKDNYNEDVAAQYLECLKSLPTGMIENCNKIFFTNEDLNKKFNCGLNAKVTAISYGRDIYISTEYFGKEVLVHEMYHVYDYANKWISDTEEFKKLYEEYGTEYGVSPGNKENCYEFFATYGELFYLQNDDLEKTPLFAFFDEMPF